MGVSGGNALCNLEQSLKVSTSRIIFLSPTVHWDVWTSTSIFHHCDATLQEEKGL